MKSRLLLLLPLFLLVFAYANAADTPQSINSTQIPQVQNVSAATNQTQTSAQSAIPSPNFNQSQNSTIAPNSLTGIPSLTTANAVIDDPVIVKAPKIIKPKRLWNLQNADIMSLIQEVSKETGKNFIVDPRVSGTVTVMSSQPLDADELYQVFLAALQVHGYAAVASGANIKIVPSTDATQTFSKIATSKMPGHGEEIVVRVVQVKYSPADQLVATLRNLMPSWSSISAYIPTNALILAGTAENVNHLVRLVKEIDSQNVTGVEIMSLRYAAATDVVATLNNLENAERNAGQRIDVWLVADKRTNSVLISGSPQARNEMQRLVMQLDSPYSSTVSLNTKVIFLHYLNAVKTAPILAKIAQGMGLKGAAVGDTTSGESTPNVSNSEFNVTTPAGESLNPSGLGMGSNNASTPPPQGSLNIQADPSTNSLIITAPPPLMMNLLRVIKKLDRRPAQVLVEAAIVEIDQSDLKQLGIQWGTVPASSQNGTQAAVNQVQYGVGLIQDGGFSNWFVLLNALEQTTRSNILSTPSVMVLNNEKATISVGKEFGVTTGSYATTGSATTATPFQTTKRESFNLELDVTPQITRGKVLQLAIQQTNNALENPENPGSNPISDTSKIKTNVIVNSGNILVLGGLISNDTSSEDSQPPILGDLPIIGRLFQYRNNELDKKDLMVFLHPVILYNGHDNNKSTQGRYNYMRQTQLRTLDALKVKRKDRNLLPPWQFNTKLAIPFSHPTEDDKDP